ncbi:MAG: glycoside hydrolase family 99-like domain-containing protein [Paludibacter sp.]|nr:glycoside hydrolase family 99-like domain-containing protein [Paludibacter sp.]
MSTNKSTRIIAFYLPQFHPIPENDEWWGKGFTEWTNVGKAKPLFKGHYQPRVPADLGYYDLRMPEIREAQAQMAKEAGIEGFCYWHYWFGDGKQILERPFNEVLTSKKPDFPFCLCWANHSWSNNTWEKRKGFEKSQLLIEQKYLGKDDYTKHFYYVLEAFNDERYIKVDDKPIFIIFNPYENPAEISKFINIWRDLASKNGLPGIHFVAIAEATSSIKIDNTGKTSRMLPNIHNTENVFKQVLNMGFDAINSMGKRRAEMIAHGRFMNLFSVLTRKLNINPSIDKYKYRDIMKHFYVDEDAWENVYPTLLPQWDRSARTGNAKGIYIDSTPDFFKESILNAKKLIEKKNPEHRILFLRSWNEWAEGNYVEPDLKYGHGYLNAIKESL